MEKMQHRAECQAAHVEREMKSVTCLPCARDCVEETTVLEWFTSSICECGHLCE